jgi:hypothetical protein
MIALALALAAAAPVQDLTLDAEAGYSGTVFQDAWMPMTAVVRNDGEPFSGELRVVLRTVSDEPLVFRRPVTLPKGGRARYIEEVYVTEFDTGVEFQLVDGTGKVRRQVAFPLRAAPDVETQVLVVGPPPRWFWKAGEGLPSAPEGAAERFPRSVRPLLAADVIVFPEPVPLEPEQQEALRRWVLQGGRLVFGAGRATLLRQDKFWRELCPVASPEAKTVPVRVGEAEVPLTVVTGAVRQGRAFLTFGGQGAGFRAPLGAGEVVFLAFPLDQERLEEAAPAGVIWPQVVDKPPPREALPDRRGRDEPALILAGSDEFMSRLLGPLGGVNLPALGLGGLGLAAYVLFIGPVSYLWLKKRGRLKRGWLPFAAAAALFSAFSLAWGGALTRRASQAEALVFADESVVQTFGALRSGDGRVHEFRAEGAIWPVPVFRTFAGSQLTNSATLSPGGRMRLAASPLAVRTFVACRTPAAEEGGVSCRWTDRGALRFEVENGTALLLRDCLAVSRDQVWRLGEVAAGARREVALGDVAPVPFAAWASTLLIRPEERGVFFSTNVWQFARREEHPLLVSFYRACRETWRHDGVHRLRPRALDLSVVIARGEVVFVGAFGGDLSGVRVDSEPETVTRGLVRRVVREGPP